MWPWVRVEQWSRKHFSSCMRVTYYAKKPPFIDVTAVPHLPECSMTPRVQ